MPEVRERLSNGTHAFEVMSSDLPNGITIAEYRRIRAYAAEHPRCTIQQVADALGVDVELVLLAYAGTSAIVEREDPNEEADRHG